MSATDWLDGKSFEELEAVEFEGRIHFPDALRVRGAKGDVTEIPVLLRVPRAHERATARVEARKWCAKLGIDPEKDPGHFDSFDTFCLVARACRERKAPKEQHCTYEQLAEVYDVASVQDIWERLNFYDRLLDPRVGDLDDKTFWQAVHAIARKRTLSPLLGIAGDAQDSFVMRMASELSSSQTAKSSSPSTETSTPER